MFHIHINMIFVTVMILSILLHPARIGILLPLLLLAPIFWNLSFLDSPILIPTVPLFRYRDNTGIYNLPFPLRKTLFTKNRFKLLKGFFNYPGLGELLPKQPDRLGIRHSAAQPKSQKPHKRKPVKNLILGRFIRKIIQGLQDKHLKHHNNIVGLCSRIALFIPGSERFQSRSKTIPRNHLVQFHKRVAVFVKFFKSILPIKRPSCIMGLLVSSVV